MVQGRAIPRPLHLGETSSFSSPSSSPSKASRQESRPSVTIHVKTGSPQEASSPCSPSKTQLRRQSTIAYYSPTAESPLPGSPLAGPSSLSRSASVPKSARARTLAKRASVPSREAIERADERGPLTLVEKHADLLQFIAQKEAKCMDLRAQLAVHEAELAQLKRKWERIVNRGLERANGATYGSISSSPGSGGGAGPSNPPGAGSAATTAAVLVQGVGRLLVSGFSDLSSPMGPTHPPLSRTNSSPTVPSSISRRASTLPHQSTQSISSASTSTAASKSTRFSQSSASSLESAPPADEDAPAPRAAPAHVAKGGALVGPAAARDARLRRRSRDGKGAAPAAAADAPAQDAPGRRASTLLADMGQLGQSFLATLAGGGASPVEPPRALAPRPAPRALASSASLLDDEEDPWALASAGSVLVPDAPSVPPSAHIPKAASKAAALSRPSSVHSNPAMSKTVSVDDFDDWNW